MEEKRDICSAIISDAEKYADETVKAAEEYADKKRKEAEFKVQAYALSQEDLAGKEIADVSAKNAAAERMEKKKVLLAAKVDLLNDVYARLETKLGTLRGEEIKAFTENLIGKYAEEGDEIVVAANSSINAETVAEFPISKKLSLKVSGGGDFSGGFMIKGKAYDRDFSFGAIVRSVKEQTESEISTKLFG